MSNTASYAFQDLINEQKVIVTELGQKTQDLITKFGTLTDDDAKDAMDEKIYGQIEDFLEAKAKAAKEAATKEKVTAAKAAKAAKTATGDPAAPNKLDVSSAATSAAAQKAAAAAAAAKTDPAPVAKTPLRTIFGR